MPNVIHWFRRDLRLRDNIGLAAACRRAGTLGTVTGIFVLDPKWWPATAGKLGSHQATFWLASLKELRDSLHARHIALVVRTGDPVAEILQLARETHADTVTLNKEYEPAQREMDDRLQTAAAPLGINILRFKDAAVFEETEILTQQASVYSVFTPYKNAYLKQLAEHPPEVAGLPSRVSPARPVAPGKIPTPASLGFPNVTLDIPPGETAATAQLEHFCQNNLASYYQTRDLPALSLQSTGTSRLSAHLTAGTLSLRQVMRSILPSPHNQKTKIQIQKSPNAFLAQLIWRDFYRMILFHHPHTVTQPFQEKYRHLTWKNDPTFFDAWCRGHTGYPIVDAALRQLTRTGFMHNRLRMIAAMFLTKDLDTHWLLGERFFMRTLIDYDQAANVGGWQWSASTGTDAAPYFRIMNPVLQSQRFDPQGTFIRHYCPELARVPDKFIHAPWTMPLSLQRASRCLIARNYPAPIVDHAQAKAHAIAKFRHRNACESPVSQ